MLKKIKNFLLDLLFPPICLTCGQLLAKETKIVCRRCLGSLTINDYLHCPVCLNRVFGEKLICHPKIGYLLGAATNYDDPIIKKIIWQYKYEGWQSLADTMADLLTLTLIKSGIKPQSDWEAVPIPLHPKRERRRGFNQSALLAEKLSWKMSLVWHNNVLVRLKNTLSQADLPDWSVREKNINGAFGLENKEKIKGKKIILVDDVFTSGATINEAAKVLRSAGAKKIIALVVAKAR